MQISKIFFLLIFLILIYSENCIAYTSEKDTSYTTYQTFQKIRKNHPEIRMVEELRSNQISQFENLIYKTITDGADLRALHLDIYRPNQFGKYPAIVMIHGGGWRSGNKSMERPMAQRIAMQGYVAIPVEYRLSLEAKYPAAIHDIKAAIRFVKDNAEMYGIDTSKIAIEGESAGGQLALLVAMTNNVAKFDGEKSGSKSSSTAHAAIDVDGVVDFLAPNSLNTPRKPESPDVYWLGGVFEEKPLIWKDASPIYWVGKSAVPVLFISSSVPRFHAGRDEMLDMLNQNGIYSESHTFADSPHSFWLFEPWFTPSLNLIVDFLNKIFK